MSKLKKTDKNVWKVLLEVNPRSRSEKILVKLCRDQMSEWGFISDNRWDRLLKLKSRE